MKKFTIKQAIETRNYYKQKVQNRIERIEKLKEANTPKIILDNEERMLKEYKHELFIWELCLDFYRKGYQDCQMNKNKSFKLIQEELSPDERLINAIFDETKFIREEEK